MPPYVQTATMPSTNTVVGPDFGQMASQWMPSLMWNPLLAMAMATPQQTQPLTASGPTYIPLTSSKDKEKRPLSPSEGTPSSKKGRYFDAVDISSDGPDIGEDEELAEPFDPSSFYSNASKKPLPDTIEKYVDLHFRSCLSGSVRKAMGREIPLPNCHALGVFRQMTRSKTSWTRTFSRRQMIVTRGCNLQ